jgi:hypothetical protein
LANGEGFEASSTIVWTFHFIVRSPLPTEVSKKLSAAKESDQTREGHTNHDAEERS